MYLSVFMSGGCVFILVYSELPRPSPFHIEVGLVNEL